MVSSIISLYIWGLTTKFVSESNYVLQDSLTENLILERDPDLDAQFEITTQEFEDAIPWVATAGLVPLPFWATDIYIHYGEYFMNNYL